MRRDISVVGISRSVELSRAEPCSSLSVHMRPRQLGRARCLGLEVRDFPWCEPWTVSSITPEISLPLEITRLMWTGPKSNGFYNCSTPFTVAVSRLQPMKVLHFYIENWWYFLTGEKIRFPEIKTTNIINAY